MKKNLMISAVALLLTQSAAFATTLTCKKSGGHWRRSQPVATLTYNLETNSRGSLEVLEESYIDSLDLQFSSQGPLTHGYVSGVVDFRVQSLVPTSGGLFYAMLTFPQGSTSKYQGKTFFLLCDQKI
jgi:hypothetical protein